MKQRTFIATAGQSIDDLLQTIASSVEYRQASTPLLISFEPTWDHEAIAANLGRINEILPNATVVGMTSLGVSIPKEERGGLPLLTLLTFERSSIRVNLYDCTTMSCKTAGRRFVKEHAAQRDLQGVMCFTSYAHLCPEPFFDTIRKHLPGIPVFGAQAGPEEIVDEHSIVFTNDTILDRGILTVAFYGEDLHIRCDYNLGWHPAGRNLMVSKADKTAIQAIDDQKACEVYRHYLDVRPNDYFFDNIGPFPLVIEDADRLIARVPIGYGEDGSLQFTIQVRQGSQIQLSYANKKDLLLGSNANACQMAMFAPQGLLLFACIVRHNLLGKDGTEREKSYYAAANRNLCMSYGYCEILLDGNNREAMLNDSLVAVGMREGPRPSTTPAPYMDTQFGNDQDELVPLTDRLSTFLSATTEDLNATISSLESLAGEDQLTGIFNRRSVQKVLSAQVSKKNRTYDVAVLMYDVDHFKNVNDTYGHDVGDLVLTELAACVNSVVRTKDTHGRWGGEEFLCVVPGAGLDEATRLAERILHAVESHSFPVVGQVTISIGVTTLHPDDTLETASARVDEAMYEAKRGGRNRVCVR